MLLVFGITAHAWWTRGVSPARDDSPLSVYVSAANGPDIYGPLSRLFARYTGREVAISRGSWDEAAEGSELYVIPAVDFVEHRDRLDLKAVFTLGAEVNDRAVVVSAVATDRSPTAGEVALAGPRSLNGCWVQLKALADEGGSTSPALEERRRGSDRDRSPGRGCSACGRRRASGA
jgi:hypothetical protein